MTPESGKELLRKTFTLKGRIFHPNLLTPKLSKDGQGQPKYDTMFSWIIGDNAAVMNEINSLLQQATQMIHQGINPAALVNPIKRFDTYVRQDGRANPDYLKNCYWVNAQSGKDFPPQVVDMTRQPVINPAEIYSGRNAVINISFYAIVPKPGATNQKRGFGVNVNAVMLLEGGQREGGAASVDVNQVFGGFVQDMGGLTQQGQSAMGNYAHAAGAPTQYPQTNTAYPGAQGQQSAHGAYPSNGQQQQYQQPQQPAWPPQNGNGGGFV